MNKFKTKFPLHFINVNLHMNSNQVEIYSIMLVDKFGRF